MYDSATKVNFFRALTDFCVGDVLPLIHCYHPLLPSPSAAALHLEPDS